MRRNFLRRLLSLTPLALLTACSGADILNGLTPKEGYRVETAITYGDDERHRLDLYTPDTGDPAALVVFFYGGSWENGERGDYLFVGEAFASRGIAVAVPDYRLYPEVRYPAFLEDSAAAVAWAHRHHQGPVFLVGHSAGAYNAIMLALDGRWLGAERLRACDTLAGAVGLAGPYDFLPLQSASLKDIFGPEETREDTQPINHVNDSAPPLLLLSGDEDGIVSPRNSRVLAERQEAAGGRVQARFYPGLGHLRLVGALSRPLRGSAPVLDDIVAFVQRESAGRHRGC